MKEYEVDLEKNTITNIAHRTTLATLLANIQVSGIIEVYGVDGNKITDTTRFVRSGMKLKQVKGEEIVCEWKVFVNRKASIALSMDALDMIPTNAETEMVAGTDQLHSSIYVYKQNSEDWSSSDAIVWQWTATESLGYTGIYNIGPLGKMQFRGIADVKLRYNEFYGGYVVAVTCGQGFLALIDYETKECLYSRESSTENNAHAVEVLPDGNMVVASSSGDSVTIYASTQGDDNGYYARYYLEHAHGVLWDPNLELLWALGGTELVAYKVGGTLEEPELIKQADRVYKLPDGIGHDLYTVYGDFNKLWVTVSKQVYQFNKQTGEFETTYDSYDKLIGKSNKSIGNQPFSNTVVRVYPTDGGWRSDMIELFSKDSDGNFTSTIHTQNGAGYYKGRVWYHQYQ